MNISTEQLKVLLEQAHSDGYDTGARNERSSLHNATDYCAERDKSVSALMKEFPMTKTILKHEKSLLERVFNENNGNNTDSCQH
jgi:hypothetical protein